MKFCGGGLFEQEGYNFSVHRVSKTEKKNYHQLPLEILMLFSNKALQNSGILI